VTSRPPTPASRRRADVHAFKRGRILDAARAVLEREGIERVSVRAIAREAGYTPGALYAYYRSHDDILADLLCRSLGAAGRQMRALDEASSAADATTLLARLRQYFRDHAGDFDLCLSVLQSDRGRHLSPAIRRNLTGRLIALLGPVADALTAQSPLGPEASGRRTAVAAAFVFGLLTLENSDQVAAWNLDGDGLFSEGAAALLDPDRVASDEPAER
jgi:AcrR family transcriptional regulator